MMHAGEIETLREVEARQARLEQAERLATFRAFLLLVAAERFRVDMSTAPDVQDYTAEVERVIARHGSRRERLEAAVRVWRQQAQILYDAVFGSDTVARDEPARVVNLCAACRARLGEEPLTQRGYTVAPIDAHHCLLEPEHTGSLQEVERRLRLRGLSQWEKAW